MTTDFQCPACGWPRGPVATDAYDGAGSSYYRGWKEAALAAPQGQELAAGYAKEDAPELSSGTPGHAQASSGQCRGPISPTDAKEGEDGTDKMDLDRPRENNDERLARVTPDIAGLEGEEDADKTDDTLVELGNVPNSPDIPRNVTPDIAGLVGFLNELAKNGDGSTCRKLKEAADALERIGCNPLWAHNHNIWQKELTAAKAEIAALERQGEEGNEHKKTRQLIRDIVRAALGGDAVDNDYAVVKKECDVYDLGDGWKADVYQVKPSSQTQES